METALSIENIIQEVRAEIGRLQQVLTLLGAGSTSSVSVKKVATVGTTNTGVPRRKISAAGRKRIAAAQRARWAKIRAAKK
jgi:hypothetical protein